MSFSARLRRTSGPRNNMARFRPPGSKKSGPQKTARGLIPCLFILIFGLILVFFLFYEFLNSGK